MAESSLIRIEVAIALPQRQRIATLEVPAGTTARRAVELSGLADAFPEVDFNNCSLGVFGRVMADDYNVIAGDRVEIYRPLLNEPREARRAAAAQGRTMGSRRADGQSR